MISVKKWTGDDLYGVWLFTYKIDGVRAIISNGKACSKREKPLYNLQAIGDGDYEIFHVDWNRSVSLVRTFNGEVVRPAWAYLLDPIDPRLRIKEVLDPSAEVINKELVLANALGYEGLVLRQCDTWLKVKPIETYDIAVLGMIEGKGKHSGRLGAFVTTMGNVGTGFTDAEREAFWEISCAGIVIEVACMSLTKEGQFRHPRFVRRRFDKENL